MLRATFVWCLSLPLLVSGQTSLKLTLGREAIIGGTGITLTGVGSLLAQHSAHTTPPAIDLMNVPDFDRVAVHQWSLQAHRGSNLLFGATAVAAIAGSIVNQHGERPLLPVAIIAESTLLSAGLTNTVKELVRRPRPYMYNADVPPSLHNPDNDYVSFWSGHTANTAAITFSTAYMVQRSDASRGVKTATWIGAALAPAAMGYMRVRAGRHFPTDVLTGYLVGAVVGIAVPYFHRAEKKPFGQ
ncbi:MAG TPA: phosphatase PAP2 family protein [Flavobacteriales bacterium]|nr:phosphatase PAP2 family protein [Flavobacteriales bacterium]